MDSNLYNRQAVNNQLVCARGNSPDRRQATLQTAYASLYRGRRVGSRRDSELMLEQYADLHEPRLFYLATAALMLSVLDCFFTLILLQNGSEELNPVMNYFIQQGHTEFFIAKFLITTICLLFLVMHKRFKLLKFVSGYQLLVGAFISYLILVIYELSMVVILFNWV